MLAFVPALHYLVIRSLSVWGATTRRSTLKIKGFILGAAAASMVIAPVAGAANRAIAPIDDEANELAGGTLVLALVGAAAAIAGVVALTDDDEPASR